MKKFTLKWLLLSIVLSIASINTTWAGTRMVYLSCDRNTGWENSSATFYINTSDATGGTQLTQIGTSHVYSAEVSDDLNGNTVYFVRCSSDGNTKWNSFSVTLDATHNCGIPYVGDNSNYNCGYLGWYFPEATEFYISDYQAKSAGGSMDFSDAGAKVWVRYYLDGSGSATRDGNTQLTNTSIETISGHKTYHFTLPKGTWDAVIVTRNNSESFSYDWGQTTAINFELGKNYLYNSSWSAYAPSLTSVSLAPASDYSGAGTSLNPYLVSPSSTVHVDASPTSPVSDGNLSVKYTYLNSDGSVTLKDQSTDDEYEFTASSVDGTTYSVKVEANNYYGATAGATARTSDVLYFQVSATPAVALSVSTAGPVASGTELTLTATPSNTTVTPTFSYYYSTNSGSTYTAIANTESVPVTSTTQTFTPAVNSPGTYQFKVVMHHNSSDYECTSYPTTNVQQRRTIAVKNKFTDLYGDVTTVDAATPSVTGIYNALSVTRDAAPDGYEFAGWEKTSNLSFVSGGASSSYTTVTMSASADDQTLTALYTAKKRIYFDNTMSKWDDSNGIWVYLFSDTYGVWWDTEVNGGVHPGTNRLEYGQMTRIGTSNVYYYEYTTGTTIAAVAFTKADQSGYTAFNKTSAAWITSFPTCLPCYIASERYTTKNSTGYHSYGYWKRYGTTHSGFTLKGSWDTDGDDSSWDDPDDAFEFTSVTPNSNTYKATIHLNAATHQFKIYRCWGSQLGNNGTMTASNHSGWEMMEGTNNCSIEVPAGGDYEFTLNLGSDHIYLSVEYPLLANDYRLLHTGRITTDGSDDHKHPTQTIHHLMKADTIIYDTVSVFIVKDHEGTLKLQKCTDPTTYDGKGTWADTASTISLSGVSETGIYNFEIKQKTVGSVRTVTATPLETGFKYTGNFYIRSDAANGGWEAYKDVEDNLMQYSHKSLSNPANFDYYFVKAVSSGKNVDFTIANDYSPCITDTLVDDDILADGNLPVNANVRCNWNSTTNEIGRAYLNASSAGVSQRLILQAKNDSIRINAETPASEDEGVYWVNFNDMGNWVYQRDIQAELGTHARLLSNFYYSSTDHNQYWRGTSSGTWSPSTTIQLLGGTGSAFHTLRLIYDFKTDEFEVAWLPENATDISGTMAVHADMLLIRRGQQAANQITFNGGKITDVKKIVGAMELCYDSIVGRVENFDGDEDEADGNRAYRELMHYISFPFDVAVQDIYGFGQLNKEWYLQYYDGAERAEKGFFRGDGTTTFWKFMEITDTLRANVGYSLLLDNDYFNSTADGTVWHNKTSGAKIYLYFPSTANLKGTEVIKDGDADVVLPEHNHTSGRTFEPSSGREVSHNFTDSHWNMMGVPLFENKTDMSAYFDYAASPSAMPGGGKGYFYEWDTLSNVFRIKDASTYVFKPMHGYMVQFAGTVTFNGASIQPASVAARRAPSSENFTLELQLLRGDEQTSRAYVELRDEADDAFALNEDVYMIYTSMPADLYTLAGNYDVSANVLSVQEHTIPVCVEVHQAGSYTFTMPGNFSGAATLLDTQTGARTNLALDDYTVSLPMGVCEGRFLMEVNPNKMPTAIDGVEDGSGSLKDGKAHKFIMNGQMYILKDGELFDARGNRVK